MLDTNFDELMELLMDKFYRQNIYFIVKIY